MSYDKHLLVLCAKGGGAKVTEEQKDRFLPLNSIISTASQCFSLFQEAASGLKRQSLKREENSK